jgi:hypothetical protein
MTKRLCDRPRRAVAILVTCLAVATLGLPSPASAVPGVAQGVYVGDARSTDCTGLIGVTCTFHFGSSTACVETVAGTPTGVYGCGVYGHLYFAGVGTTQACVGTGAGDAIVFSNVIGDWTTVPITGVVEAGVIQFAGVGFASGSLLRPVALHGEIELVAGCTPVLGVVTGTYTVAAV